MIKVLFLLVVGSAWGLEINAGDAYSKSGVIIRDANGGRATFDEFNRLRVGQPYTLGDYIFKYSINPTQFGTSATSAGSVTHSTTEAVAKLQVTTAGDTAILQTKLYHRYQAGKAGSVLLSLAPKTPQTDVVKLWGYFDDRNGMFFKLEDTGLSVCLRSDTSGSVVDTCVTSSNFNGRDHYPSKVTNVLAAAAASGWKATPYEIGFQWLGSGVVMFRMETDSGELIDLHKFKNPLSYDVPYTRTAALPIRFETTGSASATQPCTMNVICCSVVSNGGEDPPEDFFSYGLTGDTYTTTTTNEEHVVTFRLKETFGNQPNRVVVIPTRISLNAQNAPCVIKLYANSTVTGGSWTSANVLSAVEYNEGATVSAYGRKLGTYVLFAETSGTGANTSTNFSGETVGFRKFILSRNAFNTDSDYVTVTVQRLNADNVTVGVSINWGEVQ